MVVIKVHVIYYIVYSHIANPKFPLGFRCKKFNICVAMLGAFATHLECSMSVG